MPDELIIPTIEDIRAAAQRIAGHAHRTPVLTCRGLDELTGAKLFCKCENFQKAGAFKFRGACNAVLSLSDQQAARGVVTHSSGNHAAALALAARLRGVPAYIVMPENAPEAKRRAVEAYGGKITVCKPTLADRQAVAERILQQTGAVLVHPYDDAAVIAGQGTLALEFHEQIPGLEFLVTPVSGGGLISGIALATVAVSPGTQLVGVEPEQADDARQSLQAGRLLAPPSGETIADGLRRPVRAYLCRRVASRAGDHRGQRSGDRGRHAADLGTPEDHRRGFVRRRAGRGPQAARTVSRPPSRVGLVGRKCGSGQTAVAPFPALMSGPASARQAARIRGPSQCLRGLLRHQFVEFRDRHSGRGAERDAGLAAQAPPPLSWRRSSSAIRRSAPGRTGPARRTCP